MATCYLAEIRPFAGLNARVPAGWHLCDGSLLPISGNEALYSLIGTFFGGDGVSNFGLPDLRGRLPIGSGPGPGVTNRPIGASGGTESVTLGPTQMPAHTHAFTVSSATAQTNLPAGQLFANPDPNLFYATTQAPGTPAQVLAADSVADEGGDQSHENRMPSLAVNYIIALSGLYPQQP